MTSAVKGSSGLPVGSGNGLESTKSKDPTHEAVEALGKSKIDPKKESHETSVKKPTITIAQIKKELFCELETWQRKFEQAKPKGLFAAIGAKLAAKSVADNMDVFKKQVEEASSSDKLSEVVRKWKNTLDEKSHSPLVKAALSKQQLEMIPTVIEVANKFLRQLQETGK